MKPKPKTLEKSDRGFDANTFWRHYVATVDTDHEWDEERPQQGRSSNRLFLFLLLFHIFLIGSVVLYNLVSERPKPVFVDNSAPQKNPSTTAKKTLVEHQSNGNGAYVMTANKHADTVEHRVAQGDSLKSIADASGATQDEIARMNQIDVNTQLAVGSVLRVPTPKARPAAAVIPIGNKPSRSDEMVMTIQTTTAPAVANLFAAVVPAPSPKKTETVATKLPEDKPKVKVEDAPPAAPRPKVTAKVEEAPPAPVKPKATEKVQESPPAAKPKPKPTEAKAVAKTETPAQSKTAESTKTTEPAKPAAKSASSTSHTVKPKETFYSISRKYGVKVDDLMKANGVTDPGKLREGMVLKVPAKG